MNAARTEQLMEGITLHCGDNRDVLRAMPDCSVDSVVTDPPYALTANKRGGSGTASINLESPYGRARIGTGNGTGGFMGKKWDTGEVAFDPSFWNECLRVLKPGGHLIAFSGTRTYHRIACAIEDAGFEIRDQIGWAYGSGFPKSHDVSKGIDKMLGAERVVVSHGEPVKRMIPGADQHKNGWKKENGREFVPTITQAGSDEATLWQGWGTALKPAWEPICVARKPLIGTVAKNVLDHGVGAINVDACRVGYESESDAAAAAAAAAEQRSRQHPDRSFDGWGMQQQNLTAADYLKGSAGKGRWPANIVHDGSEEVLAAFPDQMSGGTPATRNADKFRNTFGAFKGASVEHGIGSSAGSAARFFYTAKADSDDRLGSKHPTVKPVDLMQWLVRLVTPKGGLVLDPFAGTGTTAEACFREGMRCVLIEREEEYQADIRRRVKLAMSGPDERKRESMKAKHKGKPAELGPLFAEAPT